VGSSASHAASPVNCHGPSATHRPTHPTEFESSRNLHGPCDFHLCRHKSHTPLAGKACGGIGRGSSVVSFGIPPLAKGPSFDLPPTVENQGTKSIMTDPTKMKTLTCYRSSHPPTPTRVLPMSSATTSSTLIASWPTTCSVKCTIVTTLALSFYS
jgi:hypothetical protein